MSRSPRRPRFGGFGTKKTAKPKEPPAPRRPDLEDTLCRAIRERVLVRLRYKDDLADRLFEPAAVYVSTRDKVCVSGVQIQNPADPMSNLEPHNFEVGKISALSLTDQGFVVDPTFDRFDPKYANGIICSV